MLVDCVSASFFTLSHKNFSFLALLRQLVSYFGLFLMKTFHMNVQCTDSDGCAVDRARAWCEMIDTIYHRSADHECADSFLISLFFFPFVSIHQ